MRPTISSETCPHWYVVHTKAHQEIRAEMNLLRWGLEVLSPKLRNTRAPPGSAIYPGVAPLFPGYIFARFDAELLLGKVRNTRGVHSVVGFGEYATPVEDEVIHLIQSRLQPDGMVCVPRLRPGEPVQVVDGPLQSLAGVFERELRREDRVQILLNTMYGQLRVQLPGHAIRSTQRWPLEG
jgi:transcription elongation factor/antiterminator RfaH